MLDTTLAPPRAAASAPLRGEGTAVSLRGVAKDFGGPRVLHGIDLEIPAGQFVAIVGRSGCGKSTLLRLIAGLDAPSGGTLSLEGAAPAEAVRLMFQEPRLLPWSSIRGNVEVGLAPGRHGTLAGAVRRERAALALAEVGLADRAAEWPSVLSGGQKQRVALARALVSRPRLLALDEPLGALDALTRIEMQALVEQVWQAEGFTAVLVTHDVGEAVALADRVILLERGRVAMDVAIDRPRPRRRGDAALAAVEARILDRLLGAA